MKNEDKPKESIIPCETPADAYPAPSVFVEEALACVEEAANTGILLRIMGGLAIYLHSKDYEQLWNSMGRLGKKIFTDIDFASYGDSASRILQFFERRQYVHDRTFFFLHGANRRIFYGGVVPIVDVFLDKLEMCHTIDFRERLNVDRPTIPLAELMLEKLQIVNINEKDVKDTVILLRAHDLGQHDEDVINMNYIAKVLCRDWGFYYTYMSNLRRIQDSLSQYEVLTKQDRDDVVTKITDMRSKLEREPKSPGWKMRARLGTRRKWYREVGEVVPMSIWACSQPRTHKSVQESI